MIHRKWLSSASNDHHRKKSLSGESPLKYRKSKLTLLLLLLAVFVNQSFGTGQHDPANDVLGEVIPENSGNATQDQGYTPEGWTPVLPFTEQEERTRQQLEEYYRSNPLGLHIDSLDPEGGPMTGTTRVTVRGGPFKDMQLLYPNPKCKFGRNDTIVEAAYVRCRESPLQVDEAELNHANRTAYCLQCEDSPPTDTEGSVPLTISLIGDFTDATDSAPFRYYKPTEVHAIYPRYGPKDGVTIVEVWGANFLNFAENTRCNFGSKSVPAHFISSTYMRCTAPFSDTVAKPILFSVSLNKQQNSHNLVNFWYYNNPMIAKLEPNYGPESGGNEIILIGSGMFPFTEWLPDSEHNHNHLMRNLEGDWGHQPYERMLYDYSDPFRVDNSNDTFCFFHELDVKSKARPINSTKMACIAPPTFNDISVTGVDLTLNNQNPTDDDVPYYYYKPPKIYDMDPKEGPTRGGTITHIYASEFKRNKHVVCIWNMHNGQRIRNRGLLLSDTELECMSPPANQTGPVTVQITYEEDGKKSESEPMIFTYYEEPILESIDPPCGPTYGQTQLTIKGKHFIESGFGKAKCVFNNTHYMNATIVSEELLYCSTPKLSDFQASLPWADMKYLVNVTMNRVTFTNQTAIFAYYHDPEIEQIFNSTLGPLSGATKSQLRGRGFANPNVCNLKVRYGAIETTPLVVYNNTAIMTESPCVNVPDAVVLSASGNGQQYARDWIYHHRDEENTFTYIQDILVHNLRPQSGPTTGRTRIEIAGVGFQQIRSEAGPLRTDIPLFVKFTDTVTGNDIGNITQIDDMDNDIIIWHTPNATEGTKAILWISYNKQNWQPIIPTQKTFSYLYYNAPQVISVVPNILPVKNPNNETAIINGENFVCPNEDCSNVRVRFGDSELGTVVPGTVLSPTQINVTVPHYPKPDIMYVDVTMNGDDYTNDHISFGFYDAYVIDVVPKLIPKEGGTNLTVKGFGFVNTTEGVRSKFASKNAGEFTCNTGTPCIKPATFIDKNNIMTVSEPQEVMQYSNHTNIGNDPFTVEVSVYGNSFTENKIQVYYIFDPDFISINRNSVPRNLQVPIIVKTNFFWDRNAYEMFLQYANFTCRYVIGDPPEVMVTQGRMETMPLGSQYLEQDAPKPTHIICPSPKWIKPGTGVLEISVNGIDYLGTFFPFESTDPAEIYRVVPLSGPKHTEHSVKTIGGGMKKSGDPLSIRIGNFGLEPVRKDQIVEWQWSQTEYLNSMLMTLADLRQIHQVEHPLTDGQVVDTLWITAPKAAIDMGPLRVNNATHGGPVFMALGEGIELDMLEGTTEAEQTVVNQEHQQDAAINSGNAAAPATDQAANEAAANAAAVNSANNDASMAAAAAAGNNDASATGTNDAANTIAGNSAPPQTGGGRRLSTSSQGQQRGQGSVEQHGPKAHRYYFNDPPVEKYYYHQPVVKKVQPTSGLTSGGTPIEVSGAWFDQRLEYGVIPYCKIGEKIVRAQFYSTVRIVCLSPPNDNLNACLPVFVSLNGVDFIDTHACFSYYTQPEITNMLPKSGPYQGGTELLIYGTRFSNITDPDNVKCRYTLIESNRIAQKKYMPAIYRNATTMMCISPNGFLGGEKVQVQLTFNGEDYSPPMPELIFHYYTIFGPFPRSGPADDCQDRSIAVRGAGFNSSAAVICQINNTDIAPRSVFDNYIMCPMCLPNKDPTVIGSVKFGITFDGSWSDFGDFYYYKQIVVATSYPPIGPSEGEGDIYFTGENFRDDFPGVQIGCRLGGTDGHIGKGKIVDDGRIKCVVESMRLVNENEALPVELSLNSDSWVGRHPDPLMYKPYGIIDVTPASGPFSGYTDVMITGKGFLDEYADRARCRFGIDSNYAIVDAEVLDYGKLVCRSPQNFPMPLTSDLPILSVPIGIAFGEEDFHPWTLGLHRFRFYNAPRIELAIPDEVRIGKFAEVYLKAYEDRTFFEPLPTRRGSDATAMLCGWEQFATSMGMYVNETFVMCVTPHISGHPEDYYRETVNVVVAMNGLDFNDVESDAYVTFVGTGSDKGILIFLLAILLLALLILACLTCCAAILNYRAVDDRKGMQKFLGPNVMTVATRDGDGTVQRSTHDGHILRSPSRGGPSRASRHN